MHMSAAPSEQPFKLSLGPSKLKSITPAKRTRAALTEDSDHEDDRVAQEAISGFENGSSIVNNESKASSSTGRKEPLVIPVQKDADWRNPANLRKRGTNLLPPEARSLRERNTKDDETAEEVGKQQYGLIINDHTRAQNGSPGGREGNVDAPKVSTQTALRTLDEEAYARLVSGEERNSSLVIPTAGADGSSHDEGWFGRGEPDGFKADLASRPDPSTLTDYETVPIEEFGAAMLRGMGWKDGEGIGRGANAKTPVKPRTVERRPNLLGLGAKHAPEELEEFGAWGKGANDNKKAPKGPKTRAVYNPLVMKNSVTGEVATEDEIRNRQTERSSQQATTEEKESRERQRHDGGNHREVASSRDSEKDRDRHRYRDKHSSRTYRSRNDDGEHREHGADRPGRNRTSRSDRDRKRHKRDRSRSASPAREARERYHEDDNRRRRKDNAYNRAGSRSRSPRRSRSRDRQKPGRERYYNDRDTERSYKRRDRERDFRLR